MKVTFSFTLQITHHLHKYNSLTCITTVSEVYFKRFEEKMLVEFVWRGWSCCSLLTIPTHISSVWGSLMLWLAMCLWVNFLTLPFGLSRWAAMEVLLLLLHWWKVTRQSRQLEMHRSSSSQHLMPGRSSKESSLGMLFLHDGYIFMTAMPFLLYCRPPPHPHPHPSNDTGLWLYWWIHLKIYPQKLNQSDIGSICIALY